MRRVIVVAACALALAGCATVTRGSSEQLQFDSQPTGAEVRTVLLPVCDEQCAAMQAQTQEPGGRTIQAGQRENGPSCITPCIATFDRARPILATFSKSGFEPQTVRVMPQMAGRGAAGVAGNVILGGVTGVIVDTATGAALDHCPNPVAVTLRRVGSRDAVIAPNLACKVEPAYDPNGPIAQRQSN